MSYIKNSHCESCGIAVRACGSRNTRYCLPCFGLTRSKLNPLFTFTDGSAKAAYLLGFFCADGYLLDTDGRKRLGFAVMDKQLFDTIYQAMGLKHEKRQQASGAWRVQFGTTRLFDELVSFGCTPRKSLTLQVPNIPSPYARDFIRGYFDGDGCFTFSYRPRSRVAPYPYASITFTSGSYGFLRELGSLITSLTGLASRVSQGHGAFTLAYAGIHSSRALFALMYDDCVPELYGPTKKQRFEEYFAIVASRKLYTSIIQG